MSEVRHVLGISGGKDSAALAIYLKDKYPNLHIEYYSSDTKCELDETIQFIDRLRSYLGHITTLIAAEGSPEPTPFDHFLKVSGGYLPSVQARWCTQKMKLAEFEKFVGDTPTVSYKPYSRSARISGVWMLFTRCCMIRTLRILQNAIATLQTMRPIKQLKRLSLQSLPSTSTTQRN